MKKLIILPLMLVGLLSLNTVKHDDRTGKLEANIKKLEASLTGHVSDLKKLEAAVDGLTTLSHNNGLEVEKNSGTIVGLTHHLKTLATHLQDIDTIQLHLSKNSATHTDGLSGLQGDLNYLNTRSSDNAEKLDHLGRFVAQREQDLHGFLAAKQAEVETALTKLNDKVFPQAEHKVEEEAPGLWNKFMGKKKTD